MSRTVDVGFVGFVGSLESRAAVEWAVRETEPPWSAPPSQRAGSGSSDRPERGSETETGAA